MTERAQDLFNSIAEHTGHETTFVKELSGGLSNDAILVEAGGHRFVVKTEKKNETGFVEKFNLALNDYENEAKISKAISRHTSVLKESYSHGELLVTNYVDGVALSNETIPDSIEEVGKALAKLHSIEGAIDNSLMTDISSFNIKELYQDYLRKLKTFGKADVFEEFYDKYFVALADYAEEHSGWHAICHNDALAANFIKTENDEISLIDLEYCGWNYPIFDITSVIVECELSYSDQLKLLSSYEANLTRKDLIHEIQDIGPTRLLIDVTTILQNALWALWGTIRAHDMNTGELIDAELRSWADNKRRNMKKNLAETLAQALQNSL